MVQFAHHLLDLTRPEPMINGAAEEHQKHSHNKKDNSHSHLPTRIDGRPDNPHGSECKNSTYKMRPSIIHNKISFGLGGHIGVSRYFGKSISTPVYGHNLDQFWDHYKSYTEIPIMLDANVYWNFKRSNLFIGVSAGINLMLGQRDASLEMIDTINTKDFEDAYKLTHNKEVDMISIQKDANNVALNHILLTFRGMIGYTYELSQDWSLRVKAGVEYQGKYSDEFKGYHIDSDYIDRYHNEDSPSMLNPFFSIGIVYSL